MFDHVLIQYTVLDEKNGLYEAKEYMDESSPTIFRQGGRKNKDEDKMLAPWCQKSVSHIDPHCFWSAAFSKKACLHRIFWFYTVLSMLNSRAACQGTTTWVPGSGAQNHSNPPRCVTETACYASGDWTSWIRIIGIGWHSLFQLIPVLQMFSCNLSTQQKTAGWNLGQWKRGLTRENIFFEPCQLVVLLEDGDSLGRESIRIN